jgi:hypothetical protein
MSFKAFLKENTEAVQTEHRYIASKRFKGEDGQPLEWVLKPIGPDEVDTILAACMTWAGGPGRKGREMRPNTILANSKIAAACVVYPDLYNKELQDSYGATKPEELLKKMLTAGEYTDLGAFVMEICGYDSFDEQVKQIKN